MKKHALISLVLIGIFILVPPVVYAATFVKSTSSFGGRVLTGSMPGLVTCDGMGNGPVVLTSNIIALGVATYSAVGKGVSTPVRAAGVVSGLYEAIPFYALDTFTDSGSGFSFISGAPKSGDWILGRADLVPETTSCYIPWLDDFPFPVKDTSQYKISNQGY